MRGDVVELHALAALEHVAHDRVRQQLARAVDDSAVAIARRGDRVRVAVGEDDRAEIGARGFDQAGHEQLDRARRRVDRGERGHERVDRLLARARRRDRLEAERDAIGLEPVAGREALALAARRDVDLDVAVAAMHDRPARGRGREPQVGGRIRADARDPLGQRQAQRHRAGHRHDHEHEAVVGTSARHARMLARVCQIWQPLPRVAARDCDCNDLRPARSLL